jgi:hypothetical protein
MKQGLIMGSADLRGKPDNVRFGSLVDILTSQRHVRFTSTPIEPTCHVGMHLLAAKSFNGSWRALR